MDRFQRWTGRLISLLLVLFLASVQAWQFEGIFSEPGSEPVFTESGYISENVRIDITPYRYDGADVYVADVYIRQLSSFVRSCGEGFNKSCISVKNHVLQSNALFGITGDSSAKITAGLVMGNGELWRSTLNVRRDICVVYTDGRAVCYTPGQIRENGFYEDQTDFWHVFLFGPSLLDADGHALKKFTTKTVLERNPRSVFGYYEPGHYCFVQVDGRGTGSVLEPGRKNRGLAMDKLAAFMESLGCRQAYNLDGGKSAVMVLNGEFVNTPISGGRRVYDAVLICEPVQGEEK